MGYAGFGRGLVKLSWKLINQQKVQCKIYYSYQGNGKLVGDKATAAPLLPYLKLTGAFPRRNFSLTNKNFAPPLFLIIVKAAANLGSALFGRFVKRAWRSLPDERKKKILVFFSGHKNKIAASIAVTIGLAYIYYETHTTLTPITGRKRFIAITDNQIHQISMSQGVVFRENYKSLILPHGSYYGRKVNKLVYMILQGNKDLPEIRKFKWSVTVVDDPDVQNAFVLPSGDVFVFTGMINMCTNDDQLGVILSHEMAHCILGHGAELLSYAHLLDLIVVVPLALIWLILPSDGVAAITHWFFNKVIEVILHLPYSRKLETEADMVGLTLAANSCLDVREAPAFWKKMNHFTERKDEHNIEWLSTHPNHVTRMSFLNDLVPQALITRLEKACPVLPPTDLRIRPVG